MSRGLALVFAVVGTLLLVSISFFLTQHQPWLVLLASLVSLLFIGFGFIVKARMRRKSENEGPSGSNS